MVDPEYQRRLMRAFASASFRVFSVFWFGFCGVAVLFALCLFFFGLAGLLNLEPFGRKIAPGAGLGFLAGSVLAMGMAIACLFAGRYLRSVLSLLNPHAKKSDEKQFESLYPGLPEEAASHRSSGTARETEKSAKRGGRMFWIFIGTCFVWVLGGALTSFVWTYSQTAPLRRVADEFITAMENGNYERAYELCAPSLQAELINAKRIGAKLRLLGRPDPDKPGHHLPCKPFHPRIWTSGAYRGGTASLAGGVSGRGNFARVKFHKVGDDWRILQFSSSIDFEGRHLWIETKYPSGPDLDAEMSGQPDLQVVEVFTNEEGAVGALIRNTGTARAPRPQVRFSRDEEHVSIYGFAFSLGAGEERQAGYGRLPQGNHSISVMVDPDNKIVESDESNNSKEVTLSWPH